MKKNLLILFSLLLILTACRSKNEGKNEESTGNLVKVEDKSSRAHKDKKEVSNKNKTTKSEEKPKEKVKSEITRYGKYQDIYDKLKDVKFYLSGGSMVESLYFYRDGYFDGVEKGGNGGEISLSLYNGKFDICEKLSDTSYLITLKRLDFDTPTGESKKINTKGIENTIHYTESNTIPKEAVGSDFILYLPETKYDKLEEDNINFLDHMNKDYNKNHNPDDKIGVYFLTNKNGNFNASFVEFKK